jgi:deoxyribose-phosphate aldolase
LFGGEYQFIKADIAAVVAAGQSRTMKVILETGYYRV